MAYTQEELTKLESAIAQGVLEVKYADKTVTYRSLKDMLQIRDLMRTSLGLNASRRPRKYAEFNKGFNSETSTT